MRPNEAGTRTIAMGGVVLVWAIAMLLLAVPRAEELEAAARTLAWIGVGLGLVSISLGVWLRTRSGRVL